MSGRTKYLFLVIATLATGALAISNQSFWIDEGAAALKAIQPTLGDWWHALRVEGHSNLQLLPHLFVIWGWEKIFGATEIALRSVNVPILFAGLAAAVWGLKARPALQFWFCLLALVNAFTWYYLNEARPYILLFSASCLVLAGLVRLADAPEEQGRAWFALFTGGLFLVSATSLIAVPFAMAWCLTAVVSLGVARFIRLIGRNVVTACIFVAAMLALGAYYLWTISLGARASGIGETSLANLAFVLYEQTGLSGLGPGRNELRTGGWTALRPFAPALLCGATALLPIGWHALRALTLRRWERRELLAVSCAVILPLALVLAAGTVSGVRILGRHLAPLFPVVLFTMAVGMQHLWQQRSLLHRAAAGAILLILLISALQMRFEPRHARDDYRSAAAVAREALARGEKIWWAADESTGIYYKVPLVKAPAPGDAVYLMNPSAADFTQLASPGTIVLSKHDIYDHAGALQEFVKARRFQSTHRFQSFEIFRAPGS